MTTGLGPRPAPAPASPAPPDLSRSPATAWVMLAIGAPIGGWLVFEIQRTIGLDSPRMMELLRTDRVFDLAMLDFFLTAGWAFLVLIERSGWKDWRLWVTLPVFFVVPTLGIVLFVLLQRYAGGGGRRDPGRKAISS